jgi:hypothetical protein
MRSIEGKMRKGIRPGYARCNVCGESIAPGVKVRAMIEQDKKDGQPGIYLAHPVCLKHYLARHPELVDHRNDAGAIADAIVRRFWVGLDKVKGWGGFIDKVLPMC